jgi:hypothetical protein
MRYLNSYQGSIVSNLLTVAPGVTSAKQTYNLALAGALNPSQVEIYISAEAITPTTTGSFEARIYDAVLIGIPRIRPPLFLPAKVSDPQLPIFRSGVCEPCEPKLWDEVMRSRLWKEPGFSLPAHWPSIASAWIGHGWLKRAEGIRFDARRRRNVLAAGYRCWGRNAATSRQIGFQNSGEGFWNPDRCSTAHQSISTH